MMKDNEKLAILNRLLKVANEKWKIQDVAQMYHAFALAAEAIRDIETFSTKPEEEPAYPSTIYSLHKSKRNNIVGRL